MRVRYTKTALRQLEKLLDYIEAQSPDGARHVGERISTLVGLLSHQPLTGQLTDRPGQRRMVTNPYPYVIFYRVVRDEVIIQRIRHTSRLPR